LGGSNLLKPSPLSAPMATTRALTDETRALIEDEKA
jgi:hypothetical protein